MSRKRPMLTGPNGERRPTSPAAAAVSVVQEMARKDTDENYLAVWQARETVENGLRLGAQLATLYRPLS